MRILSPHNALTFPGTGRHPQSTAAPGGAETGACSGRTYHYKIIYVNRKDQFYDSIREDQGMRGVDHPLPDRCNLPCHAAL